MRLGTPRSGFVHDQTVGLRVAFAETTVRDRVKQGGGTWDPERRIWRYAMTVRLRLV